MMCMSSRPWTMAVFQMFWLLFLLQIGVGQRITFPDEILNLPVGSACLSPSGAIGTCKSSYSCTNLHFGVEELRFCSMDEDIVVCCPDLHLSLKDGQAKKSPHREVSAPIMYWDPLDVFCGSPYGLALSSAILSDDEGFNPVDIYYLNDTANELRAKGFTVTVTGMLGDAIYNMTYTNGTFYDEIAFKGYQQVLAVGGKPAPTEMAFFMALVGEKHGDKLTWFCDGSLLNQEWIISAAHCFIEPGIDPNIIRLGDYDWNRTDEKNGHFVPFDTGIADVIFYPEYDANNGYHDIVLVRFQRPYPMFAQNINPICLPWNNQTGRNLVGHNVTLSGWGAISYDGALGEKHPILQAVELEVFDVPVCERSYSTLNSFRFKWPNGMTSDKTLCSGWSEGGRDACKGDSGGPLSYLNDDNTEIPRFTLAGVVSGGHGCGLKDFPGIYIPMNNPDYLEWIKAIAFKGYQDSATNDYLTNPDCYNFNPYNKRDPNCPPI